MCQSQPIVLVDEPFLNISMCQNCKRIGLHYANILSTFRLIEFKTFASSVLRTDFAFHATYFPDEVNRIVIGTCHRDIQFCFTEAEFHNFQQAMNEALLMLDVHKAMTN